MNVLNANHLSFRGLQGTILLWVRLRDHVALNFNNNLHMAKVLQVRSQNFESDY